MEYKEACPRCRELGHDLKGDNLHVYGEGGGKYCFACGYTELSDAEKERRGVGKFIWDDNLEEEFMSKSVITKEQIQSIKDNTSVKGRNSRYIRDDTYAIYGVRFETDTETGEINKHYYPITENYEASGYKIRVLPKDFTSVGKFGKQSDLFGQWKFKKSNAKTLVITAGEVDCMSAYQMLEDYRHSRKSDFEPTPVVSGVIGEPSSHVQLQKHYEWLDRFEKIVVCYDQDEAGRLALKDVVKVLPKGKMFVMDLPLKDSNKMLEEGRQKTWIDAFFKARPYTPDGIITSLDLKDKIRELAAIPKIPLPPFMHKLQSMMAGGIPLGRIINIGSSSGAGKSSIVDECVYYWIFNSPHKIGVVTLESEGGEYGTKLLSRHLGKKIDLIESINEKLDYLNSPDVLEKETALWSTEEGSPRFHLIEDRDGGLDSMKKSIESLIITCGCMVIVLDPLQDILDGLSNEDQAVFLRWMKGMTKSHNVTFININHVRKNQGGKKANSTGAELFEEDFQGSSSIFKSGACNILFTRNKEAEDEIERNTILLKVSKIRWTGRTGIAGEYYYDNETHTMYDKQDYFKDDVGF